jgi:hypothetical protein
VIYKYADELLANHLEVMGLWLQVAEFWHEPITISAP